MNQVRREIEESIEGYSKSDAGTLECSCRFGDSFSGFKGHFPGQPILPGICMVQLVLVAYEQQCDKRVKLDEIALAKYFTVVQPRERLQVATKVEPMDDKKCIKLRSRISKGGEKVSDLTLVVRYV